MESTHSRHGGTRRTFHRTSGRASRPRHGCDRRTPEKWLTEMTTEPVGFPMPLRHSSGKAESQGSRDVEPSGMDHYARQHVGRGSTAFAYSVREESIRPRYARQDHFRQADV